MADGSVRAEELPREAIGRARLVVYVASAPGAGKTYRLIEDARRLSGCGKRVAVGRLETKGHADLERSASALARIPPRHVKIGESVFEEFDYQAALREKPDAIVLDELAHANLGEAAHAARWQDALALKERGIDVIGAFDIAHLETVAPTAEALVGHAIREIVPFSFLQAADEVIALDASPRLLQSRIRAGKDGAFKEQTLHVLREMLLRTVDSLTLPAVKAGRIPAAAAFVYPNRDPQPYLKRTAAIAHALDLALEVIPTDGVALESLERITRELGGEMLRETMDPADISSDALRASLVALPAGKIAAKLADVPLPHDLFIVGPGQTYLGENPAPSPYSQTAGDRLHIGYGKLTVYLGAAAGCGKTFAMLDRAHQLQTEGIDVVAAFVETHGRAEVTAMLEELETIAPRLITADGRTHKEFDRDALIARRPRVALIDELAHTNAPGSAAPKRFYDVLAVLRAGIDVITTLNIAHLEGLRDTVLRLTGTIVRETLPDGILALADEVILIDVTPDLLRRRLREGTIYPPERIERALSSFFCTENLFALRELALREALRARYRERVVSPFDRILLGIGSRAVDLPMIARAGRIAARLAIDFSIAHVVDPKERIDSRVVDALRAEARKTNAEWIEDSSANPPARLLEIARSRPETTIALAGTKRTPRWLGPPTFARRLLDAGARELLILMHPNAGTESLPED